MTHFILISKQQISYIEDYLDSYLKKKPADCILNSEDGFQFKIHKELFGQTEFMRQILTSAKGQCCSLIEIFCPCKKEDLRHLVHFLYDGEIYCDNETESTTIFDNLSKIFGFPQNMHLQCQENNLDDYSNDSSICKVIEAYTITHEAFENITKESSSGNITLKQDIKKVKLDQSDVVKNTEYDLNDSSIFKDIKAYTITHEAFENITNESSPGNIPLKQDNQVKAVQSDVVKNTEDSTHSTLRWK